MVSNTSGRCTELMQEKITLENCCASRSVTTAWSSEDMDTGTLFFWRILGGGVPCVPCKSELEFKIELNKKSGFLFTTKKSLKYKV